jgi:hypothetical protein
LDNGGLCFKDAELIKKQFLLVMIEKEKNLKKSQKDMLIVTVLTRQGSLFGPSEVRATSRAT